MYGPLIMNNRGRRVMGVRSARSTFACSDTIVEGEWREGWGSGCVIKGPFACMQVCPFRFYLLREVLDRLETVLQRR